MNDIYKKLAMHLDNLPAGFPATDVGVELRILKKLFSEDEAGIAISLTMMPEPVSAVAERMGRDIDELALILKDMSLRGLIFRMNKDDGPWYSAAQFVIGIWEYQVKALNRELIDDVNEYIPYLMTDVWKKSKTKQVRVVPVSQSITAEMNVMPYNVAEEIIKKQTKIVVAPCICRTEHKMTGKGCDKPMESCLLFNVAAYYYEENGLGREITRTEALEILDKAKDAGLVLEPGNQKKPMNICMCCGCCCQILKSMKNLDNPAEFANTSWYAVVNADECTGCGNCEDMCQMDAIQINDIAEVELKQCIGCGLCVAACDVGGISLVEKEEMWVPPSTVVRTYVNIATERGKLESQ